MSSFKDLIVALGCICGGKGWVGGGGGNGRGGRGGWMGGWMERTSVKNVGGRNEIILFKGTRVRWRMGEKGGGGERSRNVREVFFF